MCVSAKAVGPGSPVSNAYTLAAGLTCGGILDLYIESISSETFPALPDLTASLAAAEPVALVTAVSGPGDGPGTPGARLLLWPDRSGGTLVAESLDRAVAVDARGMLDHGGPGTSTAPTDTSGPCTTTPRTRQFTGGHHSSSIF